MPMACVVCEGNDTIYIVLKIP